MIQLFKGDCLEVMKSIPDASIDAIITDPPYGTTACKWDSVIPFDLMWEQLNRIIKHNGVIVLFGSEPFSSALRMNNIKNFKYDWYFEKDRETGFLNVKKQPMRKMELISVFYKEQCTYKPILRCKPIENIRPQKKVGKSQGTYGKFKHNADRTIPLDKSYPTNLLKFSRDKDNLHPTQKPVALIEYLIKTYTNENETVLDFTMGSGTTGVACKHLNRKFIGIEMDNKYFSIAENRINNNVVTKELF
jgi:site-specific DNA-methyltransferase (adenine-specific)